MRKITDFIVDKRNIILAIFIILTIIAAVVSTKVNINNDIAKYLPSTSETRIGMDIMEQDFKEIKSSALNVMFKGLNETQKDEILEYLKDIEGVDSVDYDKTEDYNKDDYTLYVINVNDVEDSELATDVYNNIKNHFEDYEMYTSGAIEENNKELLPSWIMAVAVICIIIILTIMCESYIEPIIFLITILMAIILNSGSNIIFDSVSNITSSISAILQLALSMDYSIMLMDRYRQQKEKEPDKVKAMKDALYEAFTAIASSSVTTIVGLLALVFMSFTIGRDLGLVLAKGVLFSLICIFFVLPSFILICDKAITKTKKKTPNIRMNKLGKVSYKFRNVAVILFIAIFVASYILKGNLDILYTDSQQDQIAEVFAEDNQMVLIYKNEDEETIAKYLKDLEGKDGIESISAYGNTINEGLKYDELNEKIKDMGTGIDIEEYLIKILYYKYYNPNENNTMTFSEFTNFIKNEVFNNKQMANKLNEDTRNSINRLENFTQPNLINQKRTSTEIANILEIDKSDVDNLLIYYYSKNSSNIKISLNEFINFINKDVLTNETYAKNIDSSAKSSLNTLSKFTNKSTITKKMTSKEMANLFGMPESTMNLLYTYYVSVNDIQTKMTISEFSNFVLNDVLINPQYANMFNEQTVNSIKMLSTFSNKSVITKNMNATELSNLFGIDENIVQQLLLSKYSQVDNGTTMTISEFVKNVTNIKNTTHYLDNLDISSFSQMDETVLSNPTKYTATEMSSILGIDSKQMCQIYALSNYVQGNTSDWKMTPNEFVNLMLANSSSIDESTKNNLQLLLNVINSTTNNTKYSYSELANLINVDKSVTKNIYTLYVSKNVTTKLTPQEFVNFVLNHKNDSTLANSLDQNTISQLNLLQKVMDGTINNKKYSSSELSNLLGMNANDLNLLYGLYNVKYINTNPSMSLKDFVSFLINDVMQNPDYSSNFDKETSSKLNTINGIMNASLNNTEYTKDEMFVILNDLGGGLDKDTIDLLYVYYGSNNEFDKNWTLTVEQLVNFLNDDILNDSRFNDFIEDDMRSNLQEAKDEVNEAKELLIGDGYSRLIITTKLPLEAEETFKLIQEIKDDLKDKVSESYIIGDSPMAYEMSHTFQDELNMITILTMVAIFVVVAITFKSLIIPFILVLVIQCAVYTTTGIISISGEGVYFIALLIVQSILMGATIDYAILYTTYYIEHRKKMDVKEAIISSYNKSINTILTSSSILIIATFIIAIFSSGIISKICMVLSQGTLCALLLILFLLPAMIAAFDKLIIKKKKNRT